MQEFIFWYGCLAVLGGVFVEGETVLVVAGFASHEGYLSLPLVVLAAWIGSVASDQVRYTIGRTRGAAYLERRPYWKPRARRVLGLLHRRRTMTLFLYRFLYGIRAVAPFLFGVSGIRRHRYALWNATGALAWTVAFLLLGMLFSEAYDRAVSLGNRHEFWAFLGLLLVGAGFRAGFQWWESRRVGTSEGSDETETGGGELPRVFSEAAGDR